MYKNINVEAEHNELILENSNGDKVIIPANKRNWVKQKLSEGCHGCIDSLVETLPVVNNYAQDGTVFPNEKQPIVLITPSGRKVETDTDSDFYRAHYNSKLIGKQNEDKSWNLTDEIYQGKPLPEIVVTSKIQPNTFTDYNNQFNKNNPKDKFLQAKQEEHNKEFYSAPLWAQQAVGGYNDKRKQNDLNRDNEEYKKLQNDFIAEKLLKRTPFEGIDNRLKWMEKFSPKELETIKNSKYANEIEPSIWSKFEQGLLSVGNMGSPVQLKNPSLSQEEAKKEDNPLNILQPLNIPSKMVQSAYKKDYSFKDALSGKQNNAGIVEDIVTDPLNLVGIGLAGKLSKADKVIDATKVAGKVLNKTDDVIKNLPKLEQIDPFKVNDKYLTKIRTDFHNNERILTSKEYLDLKIHGYGNPEAYKKLNYDIFKIPEKPQKIKTFKNEETKLLQYRDDYIDLITSNNNIEKAKLVDKRLGTDYVGAINKIKENKERLPIPKYKEGLQYSNKGGEYSKQTNIVNKYKYKNVDGEVIKVLRDDFDGMAINVYNSPSKNTVWHEYRHMFDDIAGVNKNKNVVKELKDFMDVNEKGYSMIGNTTSKSHNLSPQEIYTMLGTEFRMDLVERGILKDFDDVLTYDKLIKGNNLLNENFQNAIKDKEKFIKWFNNTLPTISLPAALYLQSQNQNKSEQ